MHLVCAAALACASVPETPPHPAYCKLLLVRHGETNFNAEGRLQGRLESELTEKGNEQATLMGEWLSRADGVNSVTKTFVSPRLRTRQTLSNIEAACKGRISLPPAIVRPGLREIELTVWEGQHRADLRTASGQVDSERWAQWQTHPDGFRFEEDGHAPLDDLKRRARSEWDALVDSTLPATTSLVVAHGAFNKVFMLLAFGLPVDDSSFRDDHFAFDNCATIELRWRVGDRLASAWRKRYPAESRWFSREEEVERHAASASAISSECPAS